MAGPGTHFTEPLIGWVPKKLTISRRPSALLSRRRIAVLGSAHGDDAFERRSASPNPRNGCRAVGSRAPTAARETNAGPRGHYGAPGHHAPPRRDGLSRLLAGLATHARHRGCLSGDVSGAR